MHKLDFLDRFDRLVAFDAETTGKRTPDAAFIRMQPFAWKPPGIIIEVGFVEILRDGTGWRKGDPVAWKMRICCGAKFSTYCTGLIRLGGQTDGGILCSGVIGLEKTCSAAI